MAKRRRAPRARMADRRVDGGREVLGITTQYVGERIVGDLLLPVHVATHLLGRRAFPLEAPKPQERLEHPQLVARLAAAEYPPGHTGQIGQKGYRLVVFQYSFGGSAGGHLGHSGNYHGGPPAEFRAGDGQYMTVTLGPACGVMTETITVYPYEGQSGSGSGDVTIRVAGLQRIGTSPSYVLIGVTAKHNDSHNGLPDANQRLRAIADEYKSRTRDPLYFNDMSLPYGGLFDIAGTWTPPHAEHRNGRVIDIAATPETLKQEALFVEILRKYTTNYIIEDSGSRRHYHVRL